MAGEVAVLKRLGRGMIWEVLMDGHPMARFAQLEEAVAAVDYELERFGKAVARSAHPSADWRQRAGTNDNPAKKLQQSLWDRIVRQPV